MPTPLPPRPPLPRQLASPHPLREFYQSEWNQQLAEHVAMRARDWLAEDLGHECDWTSVAVVHKSACAELQIVSRTQGVIAGLPVAEVVAQVADPQLQWQAFVADGTAVDRGTHVATLKGLTRSILSAERVLLNTLGRLSGVATATRQLVDNVAGMPCRVYDTRKTVPGWRLLDKYATRMGGGWNHRMGLYDAILIKDNHRAAMAAAGIDYTEAVQRARTFLMQTFPPTRATEMIIEIELDTVLQTKELLQSLSNLKLSDCMLPDVLLLDNMSPAQLSECVALRNALQPAILLEASGGIRPETVAATASTGVDRVSTGWPTHNAPWLDLGLDWVHG